MSEALECLVYQLLKEKQCKLVTAESATGGMIASTLINVPGISEFFEQGYVTYSNQAKIRMIGVSAKTIETYGVVSEETAAEMAVAAATTANCNLSISVTGVAGPDGGTKKCPVGCVYIGCYYNGTVQVEKHLFSGNRMEVRQLATQSALELLVRTLENCADKKKRIKI